MISNICAHFSLLLLAFALFGHQIHLANAQEASTDVYVYVNDTAKWVTSGETWTLNKTLGNYASNWLMCVQNVVQLTIKLILHLSEQRAPLMLQRRPLRRSLSTGQPSPSSEQSTMAFRITRSTFLFAWTMLAIQFSRHTLPNGSQTAWTSTIKYSSNRLCNLQLIPSQSVPRLPSARS